MKAQSKLTLGKQIRAGVIALATTAALATSIVVGGAYADNSGLPDLIDGDADGVLCDNCPDSPNPDQQDQDNDDRG